MSAAMLRLRLRALGLALAAIGLPALSVAQTYAPPRQSGPLCVYPNGASCPVATPAYQGQGCSCSAAWGGQGFVTPGYAMGAASPNATGYAYGTASDAQGAQQLQTPPPPANMIPAQ